jgi:hypothetical protein
MRLIIRAVTASALAVALFVPASAAPSTAHLDDLRAFMQTAHDAILPNASETEIARLQALTKALAAFSLKSASLDGDVRMFGKIAAAIETANVPNADQHLQDAINGLHQDAVPLRDALAARIDALVPSKLATASAQFLAAIDTAMANSISGAEAFSQNAKDLHLALTTIAATNARITKGTAPHGSALRPGVGYFACLVDGTAYQPAFGSGRVKFDSLLVSEVTLTGYFASAAKGGVEISWSTGSFTGPGVYPLDGNSGAFVVLTSGGQTFYSDGSGGQVTVTGYDPATKRITGSFDAQLVGAGDLGGARTITKGSFDVRRYGTSGK